MVQPFVSLTRILQLSQSVVGSNGNLIADHEVCRNDWKQHQDGVEQTSGCSGAFIDATVRLGQYDGKHIDQSQ